MILGERSIGLKFGQSLITGIEVIQFAVFAIGALRAFAVSGTLANGASTGACLFKSNRHMQSFQHAGCKYSLIGSNPVDVVDHAAGRQIRHADAGGIAV